MVTNMDTFVRKPSCLESFFIDLDDCGCNMTFHYYLQLDRKPSIELLDRTLRIMLTTTHKGINLQYHDDQTWHIADEIPSVYVTEADNDDVYMLEAHHLDCRKQTLSLNVIHTRSDLWFLCFDFFHGAVDGRSGIQFMYDYFAALNGKDNRSSEFAMMDSDLVPVEHKFGSKKLPIPCWPVHTLKRGLPTGVGTDQTLLLRTMTCTRSMAAKLANAVATCFNNHAKMIIPVDLRRFGANNKTLFGNLIVPIFVDANTNRRIEDLRTEILSYVKDQSLLSATLNSLFFYNKINPKLRVSVLRRLIPVVMASKKFIICALVSPVGEIKSENLVCPEFSTEDVVLTFISFPFTAFTVASIQFKGQTNTTISWHSGRVTQAVANKLAYSIDKNLRT